MTVYSVYEPSSDAADLALRADRLAFVKEGFSWIAFLVPALWLFFYRMWLELIVFLVGFAALELAFGTSDQGKTLFGWVSLALFLLFAFEANDLRAASLERRGYRLVGLASGRDRGQAELSFFRTWLCCVLWGGALASHLLRRRGRKEDSAGSLARKRATPDSIGRCHGLIPHQQERQV